MRIYIHAQDNAKQVFTFSVNAVSQYHGINKAHKYLNNIGVHGIERIHACEDLKFFTDYEKTNNTFLLKTVN